LWVRLRPRSSSARTAQYDSVQPSFTSASAFYQERAKFKELRDYFYDITLNVDLGNTTVEQSIIDQLLAKLDAKNYSRTVYSFTITRSNGDITMDTNLGVNPVIDNHGGRYSLGKVRDQESILLTITGSLASSAHARMYVARRSQDHKTSARVMITDQNESTAELLANALPGRSVALRGVTAVCTRDA
jgi:hypothetical protein